MSINSEFYKTIGELANQVQTYSDTEKALAGQIYELRTERRRTIEAVERLEEEIRKLIIGHGQRLGGSLTGPPLARLPEPVEPAKTIGKGGIDGRGLGRQKPLKRLPDDGRAYLTVGDSAHHLGITVGALRLLYGDGMIQCYSKSMSRNKPYLFALTDLESFAKARVDP